MDSVHYSAAAKPIDKATLRRVTWPILTTSALSFVLVVENRHHPGPLLRWMLLASFLAQGYWILHLARKVGKPKSVLPPDMESSRLRIAKEHNFLCGVLWFALAAIWISIALAHPHHRTLLTVAVVSTVLLEGFGLFLILRHDKTLCRRLGYLCPMCCQPLYNAATYLNGRCPKCKQSVLSKMPATVLSSSFDSGQLTATPL